jgi:hypothetical protein
MDPENDIYGLAQAAGVTGYPNTPNASYADQFNAPLPSVPGNYTDEDIMAHFAPESGGPVTSPEQVPSGLAQPPVEALPPIPTKVKGKVSVSSSGYSAAKNATVRKGPGAELDANIANIEAQGADTAAARSAPAIAAAQNDKQAAHEEALATADQITAMGHQKKLLSDIQNHYDNQTNAIMMDEQAKAAETKANYVAALNDYRAARVDTTRISGTLGAGVVAFVQDFLGAGGIHTNAMGTLNKLIDRDIDNQVRAIQQKGQVTEGFKTLWDMQMRESSSIEETRTRMRGFMLSAAKDAVESHMAQYDAALATAKGQAAVAKIDTDLVKTINQINEHVDAVTGQRIGQAVQWAGDKLRASMESARIGVERERLQMDKAKANAAGDPNVAELVYDNSKSGGGYANGVFKPGISDKEKQDFRTAQADTNHLTDLIQEYQGLYRKHGNMGAKSTGGTRFTPEEDARMRQVAGEILMLRKLKLSGKASTQQETDTLKWGSPDAVFGMTRSIASQLADTEARERRELNTRRAGLVFDLPEKSDYRKYRSGMGGEAKAELNEADLVRSGEDKVQSPEQHAYDNAVGMLEKHSAFDPAAAVQESRNLQNKVVAEPASDVKADHERFYKEHPDLLPPVKESPSAKTGREGAVLSNVRKGDSNPVLGFESGLTGLKRVALFAKEKGHEETYKKVVETLQGYAGPALAGKDDPAGLYALQMLDDLGEGESPVTAEEPEVETGFAAHEALPPVPESKRK